MPAMTNGKYPIELCPLGGVRAGVEGVIASDDDLTTARRLYRAAAADNAGRVVLLRQNARIPAHSDRRQNVRSASKNFAENKHTGT